MPMTEWVGGQRALDAYDHLELALGTPPELWLGVEGETSEERLARLDAARDILTDQPDALDAFTGIFRRALRTPGTVARLRPLAPLARRLAATRTRQARIGGAA